MKKWLKISLISLGSLIGFFVIVFTIVCYILFTPSRLTPLVNRFANEFVNADISVEKVDLSYFSVYPFVRLNITNVLILERVDLNDSTVGALRATPLRDTLTFIPVAKAKLNFNQFLFQNNLILTSLELRGGVTNVCFDENGKFNWDIFPESETTDTTSTALDSMFNKIDIEKIIINSGRVNYRDEQNGQVAEILNANLIMDGSFIDQKLLAEVAFNLKHVDFSDGSNNVQLGCFQATLKGDLFNKQVDVISEITMDSLNFKDQSMHVFFPHMTLHLESESNFKDGKIRVNTVVEHILFELENEVLLNKPNLKLILVAEYFSESEKISIEKGEFFINDIPFRIAGNVEIQDSSYLPNLTFGLDTTRFSQIDELLPKQYAEMLKEFAQINDGEVFLNGKITGKYNDKTMPNVDVTFGLKNMDMVVQDSKIDTLNLLADVKLRMNDLKNSTLNLHDFYYSGNLGTLSATAVVKGFTDNPHIETQLHTDLNLRRLYRLLLGRGTGWQTRGTIHADLKANFALKDAMNMALDKISVDGVVGIDSLLVRNRRDSINVWADFARLRFGAQADDDGERQGAAQFRVSVRLDSLDFAYKNLYTATVGRFSGGYRYETPVDGGSVNPQSARISFRGLRLRMPQERMRVNAGRTSARIRIEANPDKSTSPVANIRMSLDSLNFRQSGMAVRLNKSELNLALMPQKPMVREGRENRQPRDTTLNPGERRQRVRDTSAAAQEQRRLQRIERLEDMTSDQFIEKLMAYMDVLGDTNVDIAQKFMSEFSYEGSLVFDTFRMRMPDFPMPILVQSTEVHLTPQTLSLNNAQVVMGNTDMTASGSLENFRRALAGRGTLRGSLDIKSNKIDGNQLMLAMKDNPSLDTNRRQRGEGRGEGRRNREPEVNRFEQMDNERRAAREGRETPNTERRGRSERVNIAENTAKADDLDDMTFLAIPDSVIHAENSEDDKLFDVTFEAPEEASLFMIPRLLSLTMDVNVDTLIFGKGVLTNLYGEVEVRDEHLRLNDFKVTNGAGEMDLALAYRAYSLKEAHVWMDLQMENTDIQNLVELYPDIVNDMPALQSLEGLIDLHLTLTTLLDSAMDVNLDKTKASVELHGQNLVLLDGEDFAKIAKMLRFRNRDRNLIDSMSVSLIVNDGIIEIFPFKLTMDRYVLAVGGTQDLDMHFNYHITVLKSPIPFTMGINISGTPEKMGFPRLVAPRFKDMATPATSTHMQQTINAQHEFRRILYHELHRIVGHPEN
jgi:uncharacterized protein involved in outer membrane biogenesis